MRRFLVKNFVGNTTVCVRLLRLCANVFFIPAFVVLAVLRNWQTQWLLIVITGVVSLLCYLLPAGKKREWSVGRASRFIYWYVLLVGIVFTKFQPDTVGFLWFHWVLMTGLIILLWIGFNRYKIGYFDLWPAQYTELDEQQRKQLDELPLSMN